MLPFSVGTAIYAAGGAISCRWYHLLQVVPSAAGGAGILWVCVFTRNTWTQNSRLRIIWSSNYTAFLLSEDTSPQPTMGSRVTMVRAIVRAPDSDPEKSLAKLSFYSSGCYLCAMAVLLKQQTLIYLPQVVSDLRVIN